MLHSYFFRSPYFSKTFKLWKIDSSKLQLTKLVNLPRRLVINCLNQNSTYGNCYNTLYSYYNFYFLTLKFLNDLIQNFKDSIFTYFNKKKKKLFFF